MVTIQCDEHIKKAITEGLRSKGIEVHRSEEGMKGLPDKDIFSFCAQTGRTILTEDSDFLRLAGHNKHAGIIFISDRAASPGDIVRAVVTLIDCVPNESFRDNIFYVP